MRTILLSSLVLISLAASSQITTPIVKANFGVDADLRANYLTGTGVTGGADDWFWDGTAGTGRNVIDTTGAAKIVAGYNSDVSPWPKRMTPFYRGMSVPTFSIINNRLWLDALFVRDYHGTDTTVFTVSSKNGESPGIWTGGIQNIPDKNDILDVMMHVRRMGPNTTDSLWMFGGISMDNVTGDRYFDFELYQTDIYYDRVSQKFYGYGTDGGHTSWKFDATGKVIRPGDIIFSASFQSNVLTSIEARIWVSATDWATVTPTAFNWTGNFDGGTPGAAYGYASIGPKTVGAFYTGLGNPSATWSGPFNLVLQSNALQFTNPAPASTTNGKYIADQYIEFSVNLTKIGLDPVTSLGTDVCGTPFERLLVKTRSSASFTADLKDFVAPIDLFLAPRAQALPDIPFFCGKVGVSHIDVQNPSSSSVYTWSTSDGDIVGTSSGPSITVDKPGTYMVTQRLSAGCNPYAYDTVTIILDTACHTLDVTDIALKGVINNKRTRLDWSTSNTDISYFEVERSLDGVNFNFVGHVDAVSQAKTVTNYSLYDDLSELPIQPSIYYRLKIRKVSGGFAYSKMISIPYGSMVQGISISPNPAHDMIQLSVHADKNSPMELFMYDASGKMVRKMQSGLLTGTNVITVDQLSSLQRGMYLVVVSSDGEVSTQKVILAR